MQCLLMYLVSGKLSKPAAPSDDSLEDEEEEGGKEYSGEIEIPNLSEENDVDDIDVRQSSPAVRIM